jgi:diguanylate cyclase (GGDEF)-like protein
MTNPCFCHTQSVHTKKSIQLPMLRFAEPKESEFLTSQFTKLKLSSRVALGLGIVLYSVFAILDYWFLPETKHLSWLIRFGIVCPVLSVGFAATFLIKSFRMLESLVLAGVFTAGVGIISIIIIGNNESNAVYWAGLLLVIVFTFILTQVRFSLATLSMTLLMVLYTLTGLSLDTIETHVFFASLLFLFSALVISMTGGYMLEYYRRREYEQVCSLNEKSKQLDELSQEYKKLSLIDGLTGIPNRRYFEQYFDMSWRKAVISGSSIAVLFIDVDYFKKYNDTYGHQAGDNCLVQIATVLSESLHRPDDFVARYGGEEFILVLSNTDAHGTEIVAERLRATVESMKINSAKTVEAANVTISIGAAVANPEHLDNKDGLVDKADQALYAAKQKGRNRTAICLYNSKLHKDNVVLLFGKKDIYYSEST